MSDGVLGRVPRNKGFITALVVVLLANLAVIIAFQRQSSDAQIERIEFQEPSSTAPSSTTSSTVTTTTMPVTVTPAEPTTGSVEEPLGSAVEDTEPSSTVAPPITQPPATQPRTTRPPTTQGPASTQTTIPPTTAAPSTTPPTIPDVSFPEPTVLPDGS